MAERAGDGVSARAMGSPHPESGATGTFSQKARPQIETHSNSNVSDLSTSAQRQRLLAALRLGPVTTIGARRDLAVMHPAMRVLELRADGFDIALSWSREADDLGVVHRQGRYVLLAERQEVSL